MSRTRHLGALTAACFAAFSLVSGSADAGAQIMTYHITRTATPPNTDGVLDDACWKEACVVEGFAPLGRGDTKGAAVPTTRAFMTYDADFLYVAFQCDEPLTDRLVSSATEHDGRTWADDGVELFFNPSGDRRRYIQIAINVAGVVMDSYCAEPSKGDLAFETGTETKTRIGEDEWSIEIKIPFAGLLLTSPSGVWTFHLARNRAVASQHLTALRSPAGGYHEIAKFDLLEGISLPERPVGVLRASPGEMFQGINICRVTLKNWGERGVPVTVAAGVAGEEAPQRRRKLLCILPGAEVTLEVPWELRPEAAGKKASIEVTSGERLLQVRSFLVKEVPEVFGSLRRRVFYFKQSEFVRIELPVLLAEGSRRDLFLRWEALTPDGNQVGAGLTVVPDRAAVIRLYWVHWQDGRYTIRFILERGGEEVASAEEAVRLVMNPWGE